MDTVVYIKAERDVEIQGADAYLKDLADITCKDEILLAKLKTIKLYHFKKDGPQRIVFSIVYLIHEMEKIDSNISVESIGEPDTIVRTVQVPKQKVAGVYLKIILICLVSFFGTAFTIISFHNDIGITKVFEGIYDTFGMTADTGHMVLEIAYSIGLAVGILIFFNHIGKRRISNDPTPIEVEMRTYEEDVEKTIIKEASREGKEKS